MTDQSFGFTVKAPRDYDVYGDGKQVEHYGWAVSLPHSCDRWEIVPTYSGRPFDQAEAIAEFERFIAEAQQALTALREGREFGAEEQS